VTDYDDEKAAMDIEEHNIRVTVALHSEEEAQELIAVLLNAGFTHYTLKVF
jgi:hypothetical protein